MDISPDDIKQALEASEERVEATVNLLFAAISDLIHSQYLVIEKQCEELGFGDQVKGVIRYEYAKASHMALSKAVGISEAAFGPNAATETIKNIREKYVEIGRLLGNFKLNPMVS